MRYTGDTGHPLCTSTHEAESFISTRMLRSVFKPQSQFREVSHYRRYRTLIVLPTVWWRM